MVTINKKFKRASIYSSSGQKRADKIAYQIIEILENLGVEVYVTESLSDIECKLIINELYKTQQILIDPHTAIGIGVANKLSLKENTIILSTAHPAKFSDVVVEQTGKKPELPANLKNILVEKERYKELPKDLKKIKNYILKKNNDNIM